jgi:hypothetical protein
MSLPLYMQSITVNNNQNVNQPKKSIEQDMKNRIHLYMKGFDARIKQQIEALK